MSKWILAAGILLSAVFVATPAFAQYGSDFTATVSDTTVVAGTSVTIAGSCPSASTVDVTLGGTTLGTIPVDPDGTYSGTVTIPNLADGPYVIDTTCGTDVLGLNITVGNPTATTVAQGPDLARTGSSNTGMLVRVGGLLVLVGAGAVVVAGRRRTA